VQIAVLCQRLGHIQPPSGTNRYLIGPTSYTHPTDNYGATPLLRQVCGGCYIPGGVLPLHIVGVDLDGTGMYTVISAGGCKSPTAASKL
jgi:hypothetical protein